MTRPTEEPAPSISAEGLNIAVVVSRYNVEVTDRLLSGAVEEHRRLGGRERFLSIHHAPGAFETPAIAMAAANSGRFDAIVALACLIKGETMHDRVIADAVAQGLMRIATEAGVAVGFGVLTVNDQSQALARAGGAHGDKGAEALRAAVETARCIQTVRSLASTSR